MAISEIVEQASHRYLPLPERKWKYFQQWDDTFFLHWSVKPELISELLPTGLVLDTFQDKAWISLVAFDVHKMRMHYIPRIPYISNFKEINVRTYVLNNGIKGIYMLSIETNKIIEVLLTRTFLELPYRKSYIKKSINTLFSSNGVKNYKLLFSYKKIGIPIIKTPLDYWLNRTTLLVQCHRK
ncbi:DUF2071 domain-containing protein [Flavobacterium sp. DG2-3]|uniref:DUF2071 domain-containing protein n=1 Tax=Flavobacterium sp. DG2-3 TaxID=3068317 RepID=UPI0027400F65|nr:DUF2071 domain-containing protein [Flavobacterium sp. DG2-3]MDP5200310.1 DUF2071 domain-containing protein [Flavobacterium sp. DG2-3]